MPASAKYIFLCDDVRVENNGKLLVVGLYTGDMSAPQIPVILPTLTFLMCLDSDRPGDSPFRMKLQNLETGRPVVEGMGGTQFARPETAYAPRQDGWDTARTGETRTFRLAHSPTGGHSLAQKRRSAFETQ
jgi:hypothetical protein